MKLKKLITAFTGVLLVATLLAACGSKKEADSSQKAKQIRLKLLALTVAKLKFLKTLARSLFLTMAHLTQFKRLAKENLSLVLLRKIYLTT